MDRFTTLEAVACPLGLANIDTDQLIPARFMSRSRDQGYGSYLLHDLRFHASGEPRSDFILNAPRYANAKILVARRNLGTGAVSSCLRSRSRADSARRSTGCGECCRETL